MTLSTSVSVLDPGRTRTRHLCLHLDELELHAVRPLEEAHPPAARDDGSLEDVDALGLELFHQRVELVGVQTLSQR